VKNDCVEQRLPASVHKDTVILEVLNPSGAFESKGLLTSRTTDLKGKTICLQWQGGWRGDVIFPYLQNVLAKRIPDVRVLPYTELPVKYPNQVGEKDFVKVATEKGCDAVILGMAG
jgi:hypothetical protein